MTNELTWCFFLAGHTGDRLAGDIEADAQEIERAARGRGRRSWIVHASPGGGRLLRAGPPGEAVAWEAIEANAGDPASLQHLLEDALAEAPGGGALVIGGHGTGWEGVAPTGLVDVAHRGRSTSTASPDRATRSGWRHIVAYHASPRDAQDSNELRAALVAGLSGRKLALLGFDACLMGAWEMMGHLADLTEVIVASPQQVPAGGWPYASLLGIDAADVEGLGRELVRVTIAAGWGVESTLPRPPLVAVRTSGLARVNDAVAGLARALEAHLDRAHVVLLDASAKVRRYVAAPGSHRVNMVDLGGLANFLRAGLGSELELPCGEILEALSATTIMRSAVGTLPPEVAGISIYLPPPTEPLRREYGDLPSAAPWARFLQSWHAFSAARA